MAKLAAPSDTLAIMPTYMRRPEDLELTQRAIKTFLGTTKGADLIVVDDGSPNRELVNELLRWQEDVTFELHVKRENEGFAKTTNVGMRTAYDRGQHALLVNADVVFHEDGWLDHMRANEADIVGALLLFPNGLVQHAGVFFSVINRVPSHIFRMAPRTLAEVHKPRTCPVTGALMLVKHETMSKIGYLDEAFGMGFEDVDYCYTAFQKGLTCAYEPKAVAIHHESAFRHANITPEQSKRWDDSFLYLHEKHRGWNFADYVPTLLLED